MFQIKREMQIFVRIIVLLFVIPFSALLAGMVTAFFVQPALGVELGKQGAYPLIVILVGTVGAIWLYVRSWKKPDVQAATPLPPRSPTSMRSGFVWALIIVVGGPIFYVMVRSSWKDAEQRRQPGHAAFQAANTLLTGASQGNAHGNTAAAQELASAFSSRLKEARNLGIESRTSTSIVSLTRGEFLTYCLLTKDSCVFMVHVPDLRNFSPEAKNFIADAAWIVAQDTTEPLKAELRSITVGLRGALLYGRVISGSASSSGKSAFSRHTDINDDTACRSYLQGYFAPPPRISPSSMPATTH